MDHVRVMLWCTTCVPGVQLPLFAASAEGVFKDRGLDVAFVPPSPFRDMSLRGLSVRVDAVEEGQADFAVTAVPYLLAAQADAAGKLGTRFVSSFHQRSPVAGIVAADSAISEPEDLAGRPTAGHSLPWMTREYEAALAHNGLDAGPVIDAPAEPYGAGTLGRGAVEVVPAWADVLPTMQKSAARRFRTVPIDVDVYATGLLAADRVPDEVVSRMTDAVAAGTAIQRANPEVGIDRYTRAYPQLSPDYLRLAWSMYAPNAPTEKSAPRSTDRWEASVAFYAQAYGLPTFDLQAICHPEILGSTVPSTSQPLAGMA